MNRDKELLRKITLGSLRMEEDEKGYITFSRLTKKQENLYIERGFSPRHIASASVKLEFYTTGGEICFDYRICPGTKRAYYSIDLLVNGVFCYHIAKDTSNDFGSFKYVIPWKEHEQRVTIYFPSIASMRIKNIILPDDHIPHRRKRKILALGDSTMQGYYPNHFQNTYANIVADKWNAELLNQAIGGSVFCKNFLDKIAFEPDFIMVCFGINDWVSGQFRTGEDARAYFTQLTQLYPQKPVFVIIPFEPYALARENPDLVNFDGEIADEFASQTLQDVREILLEIVRDYKKIIPINAKDFVPRYFECFYGDKIHFSDLGNVIAGNKIFDEIKRYIENWEEKGEEYE